MLVAAGCSPGSSGEDGPFAGQEVDWRTCYDEQQVGELADWGADPDWLEILQCGTVTVPLDHDRPDGTLLDIALIRAPATGPAEEHRGSLVLNPGGPGVSGIEMLDFPFFGDDVRAAFDLVSFDPRGVGESGGFACGDQYVMDDALQRIAGIDPADLTDVELQPLEDAARRYAESCTEAVGEEFLAHLGTVNVVRDLDVIRDALGDERLSFVGYSYGTHIGALHAQMFPERTRALVLDGAVETELSNAGVALDQVAAHQNTWDMFVAHCTAGVEGCPFAEPGPAPEGADGSGADARMGELMAGLDRDPAEAEGIPVDGATLLRMIGMELYYEESWGYLAELLVALGSDDEEGTARHLGELYDNTFGKYKDVDPEDVDPRMEHQDANAVFTAVNCADRADPEDVADYRDAADRADGLSPLFGPALVWEQLPCAYWPESEEAPTGFTAPDAPPIVVIGTVGDPATPYAWAEELAEQLETGVLVTYEGAGHTLYGKGRSDCVDRPVDAYLLTGEVPRTGLTCPRT
ncbi:alpha/beta hydrolase [Nocardiopsis sp. NPDC058631]|uniref:alpha/beta hydrolase n=1 Tax=Nocardiopsis sp. NPDC058631 TaxID=3346566 RepID=UPI0036675F78